jgi:Tol biopolymer transport system component
MPLSAGSRLGSYEILALIGAGGMGEVYRARDSKLNREVAIKVLPEAFANDSDRMARFEREAQVLASLNHPHIAAIYGLEESDGMRALVMELVEGPTLGERIGGRATALGETLPIAKQIAEALEYAHEKGIIHRDLKPANVKLTADGNVKVLDFGLAKALEAPASAVGNPSISPTLTIEGTRAGVILGTAAYMSPEQARGKAVDKRADIWSFGVVLYEMLTGKQAFTGETITDVLAAVVKSEPDWEEVPLKVRRLLESCLQKDPKRRLRDIGDAWPLMEEAPQVIVRSRSRLGWVAAVLAMISIGLGALLWRATRPVDRPLQPLMRLSVDLGPDALAGSFTTAAISPDGTRLVFPTRGSEGKELLATRVLDQTNSTVLSGTENGSDAFFSPDGESIGFFAASKLKKVAIQGGAAITLCEARSIYGASWGEDGTIVLGSYSAGLSRIPSVGGKPQPLTKLGSNGEITHRWPQILPSGQAVLYTASTSVLDFDDASVAALSLVTGQTKTLVRGGYFGRYLPTQGSTGHLLYVNQGVLFAVPFDPARLELRGTAVPLIEDVAANAITGAGQLDVSRTGTLVYRSGNVTALNYPVMWMDHSGKMQPLLSKPSFYTYPRFSPDGQQLALTYRPGVDILVHDLQRDTSSRLTLTTHANFFSLWTPDSRHVVFRSISTAGFSIEWLRADGAGEAQPLLESKNQVNPTSFSPDGRRLAYFENDDLWTLPLDTSDAEHPKPAKPEPFLRTPATETYPAFSPDGHWMAYQSDESGQVEIYVRPFPGPGGKWQISTRGGQYPMWSQKNQELFYESLDSHIMVADYTGNAGSFDPGKPRLWSDREILSNGIKNLDLAPDGKRFAVFPLPEAKDQGKGSVHVTFLLNFFDELRRRVPVSK